MVDKKKGITEKKVFAERRQGYNNMNDFGITSIMQEGEHARWRTTSEPFSRIKVYIYLLFDGIERIHWLHHSGKNIAEYPAPLLQ